MAFSLYEGLDNTSIDEINAQAHKTVAKSKEEESKQLNRIQPVRNASDVNLIKDDKPPVQEQNPLQFIPNVRRRRPVKRNVPIRPEATSRTLTRVGENNEEKTKTSEGEYRSDTTSGHSVKELPIGNVAASLKSENELGHKSSATNFPLDVDYDPTQPTELSLYFKCEEDVRCEEEWQDYLVKHPEIKELEPTALQKDSQYLGIRPPAILLENVPMKESESQLQNESISSHVPEQDMNSTRKAKKGFAKRLLQKFGWQQGLGLGVNNDGIAQPLRPNAFKKTK
ncbi:RNA-binding protein [Schizosaccharomyces japonicus yFS275]|uniref:RNA-binding protein n=1 Tax=Schizosaccharomyces japonicus (strain yFS275 / FY16936) TaxID=402676 RepID=B6K5C0_SCHJY|nr:RNA-binding protein [Schizosaccharomyces japonicus yFS275]EEB08724.1 RNA-binding protein [Schizosaccharomyces japonicus yFS275]